MWQFGAVECCSTRVLGCDGCGSGAQLDAVEWFDY